ncbi:photosynthetic complex putative assembly protein PuhB [Sphingobium algorifonticola]|uniref:PH domain-containing protein n=1 Tax=Sphingobium algorifonticola TaxID=2008318 RepID=A0A437J5Y8_9SPHN|nr:photosynthetic complex putative assembly protein PuhB [Sphingobium algorifonticola]RVT40348.1 PH domain-containing protein [Sphingobium algorifonticola]
MEHENEPVPGLPAHLPPGERILWQGAPDWKVLARTAFHTRLVAGYFAVLTVVALADGLRADGGVTGCLVGVAATAGVGIIGVGLLHLLAWGTARSTLYTLTNRRIVLRIGIALPKCINLPLSQVGSIDIATRADGSGDLPLAITGAQRLGYAALWPHARPWKIATPQPMLRAVPNAADIATLIARTCLAANPAGHIAPVAAPAQTAPAYGEVAAA